MNAPTASIDLTARLAARTNGGGREAAQEPAQAAAPPWAAWLPWPWLLGLFVWAVVVKGIARGSRFER